MAYIYSTQLSNKKVKFFHSGNMIGVTTYPRVHMFSLDLSDASGSLKSGSMGLSLRDFPINVSVELIDSKEDIISSEFLYELLPILNRTREKLKQEYVYWKVNVIVPEYVGRHTGLGTTTQITGAVALCAAKSLGVDFDYIDLFNLGIGYASALGLNLLFNPGFIIENGYKISTLEDGGCKIYPDLYDVYQLPTGSIFNLSKIDWSLILAIPKNAQSLYGKIEDEFWNEILPDSLESTHKITYSVLEKIIPNLITNNYVGFIDGMRDATRNGTKPAEESIQNPKTAETLAAMRRQYTFAAISSLGPTIYSFSEVEPTDFELNNLRLECKDFIFYTMRLADVYL